MTLPPGWTFLGEKPPMRRATDRWFTLALLGAAIWAWTQVARWVVMEEPWYFILPLVVGTTLLTFAEGNLIRLWWWWRHKALQDLKEQERIDKLLMEEEKREEEE